MFFAKFTPKKTTTSKVGKKYIFADLNEQEKLALKIVHELSCAMYDPNLILKDFNSFASTLHDSVALIAAARVVCNVRRTFKGVDFDKEIYQRMIDDYNKYDKANIESFKVNNKSLYEAHLTIYASILFMNQEMKHPCSVDDVDIVFGKMKV